MKPTKTKIYKLHIKYAQSRTILKKNWIHSEIIKEIALLICKELKEKYQIETDVKLIKSGALVHDIGVYKCFGKDLSDQEKITKAIKHGQLGYDILKKEKYSEQIARFALTHVGTGVTKEHIKKFDLPLSSKNRIPISLEEEIICYSDLFHSKRKDGFKTFKQISDKSKDFSDEKVIERFKMKFGVPNLDKLKNKYNEKYNRLFKEEENNG